MKEHVEGLSDGARAPSENVPVLTAEQMDEIDRRLDDHARNPASAIPWQEVRARLWSRIG
jgi:putative addiction module component (TIGR02574 family)